MLSEVVTAAALLVDCNRRVLLGRRALWKTAWPGFWDAIGGRVDAGESTDVAVIREVQEEVGVLPTDLLLMDTFPEPRPDLYGDALHHVFAVRAWSGGSPRNACEEHSEIRWFTLDEIDQLVPIAGRAIRNLLGGQSITPGRRARGRMGRLAPLADQSAVEPMTF